MNKLSICKKLMFIIALFPSLTFLSANMNTSQLIARGEREEFQRNEHRNINPGNVNHPAARGYTRGYENGQNSGNNGSSPTYVYPPDQSNQNSNQNSNQSTNENPNQ